MTTRWARFARGWAAALVSTFVAAFSHAVAGGPLPGVAGFSLCIAFAGIVCIALTGTRPSRMRLLISVGVSQGMFHGVFSLLAEPAAAGAPVTGHHIVTVFDASLAATVGGIATPDAGMWLSHAASALATFAILRRGERALGRLLEAAAVSVAAILRAIPQSPLRPARPVGITPWRRCLLPPALQPLLSPMRHRGPPVALA